MGAYEAQTPPSADFDQDNNIDGRDFLFWQRGFGTRVGALKSDGNSDDDGDVDASDEAAWEAMFGEGVVSGSESTSAELQMATHQDANTASARELIDVALAMELVRSPANEHEVSIEAQQIPVEVWHDVATVVGNASQVASAPREEDPPAAIPATGEDAKDPWLADELLARVIG